MSAPRWNVRCHGFLSSRTRMSVFVPAQTGHIPDNRREKDGGKARSDRHRVQEQRTRMRMGWKTQALR